MRLVNLKNLKAFVTERMEMGVPYAVAVRQYAQKYQAKVSDFPSSPSRLDRAITALENSEENRKESLAKHHARLEELKQPVTLQGMLNAEKSGDYSHVMDEEQAASKSPRAEIPVEELPGYDRMTLARRVRDASSAVAADYAVEYDALSADEKNAAGMKLAWVSARSQERKAEIEEQVTAEYTAELKATAAVRKVANEVGGSYWEHPETGEKRWYMDADDLATMSGLEVERYKSGNISGATLDGEPISNSEAARRMGNFEANKFYLVADDSERGWSVQSRDAETAAEVQALIEQKASANA